MARRIRPVSRIQKIKNEINNRVGELFCNSQERSFKHCSEELCGGAKGICIENPES
jgi:hypothetical protein